MSGTYRDLKAWQKAMTLVKDVYRCTATLPREELFGLTSQMRRAAVSVASNIAEGKGRASDKELRQFLNQGRGSLFELETQVEIAYSLSYLSSADASALNAQSAEIGKMINGLIKATAPVSPLKLESSKPKA